METPARPGHPGLTGAAAGLVRTDPDPYGPGGPWEGGWAMMEKQGAACRMIDEDAMLAEVASRYRSVLNAYFRRRAPLAHDYEDLTQEVLLRLVRRGYDTSIRNVQPYVFQIAANVLVDHVRRRKRLGVDRTVSCEEDDYPAAEETPEQVMLGDERIRLLRQEIASLPERARQAFLLFRFENMKQADIAAHMGISVSAVEKHIKLGMIRLASAFAD
jgi:RNA polymerase sigma-19 factor, ECF subfamily